MKYHNKGGAYQARSNYDYTEWIKDRARRFNVLRSVSPLKCIRPNKAVHELVYKVVEGLESNEDSKANKFFKVLEDVRWRYNKTYGEPTVIPNNVKWHRKKDILFNLTDIIKDINNEIKVQCNELVEKGSNKCYEYMNTEIKESTKKID